MQIKQNVKIQNEIVSLVLSIKQCRKVSVHNIAEITQYSYSIEYIPSKKISAVLIGNFLKSKMFEGAWINKNNEYIALKKTSPDMSSIELFKKAIVADFKLLTSLIEQALKVCEEKYALLEDMMKDILINRVKLDYSDCLLSYNDDLD